MPVLMLILITVLNDGTLISVAYDHVKPSRHPEKWNLKVCGDCGRLLGIVACIVCLSWGCIVLWVLWDRRRCLLACSIM